MNDSSVSLCSIYLPPSNKEILEELESAGETASPRKPVKEVHIVSVSKWPGLNRGYGPLTRKCKWE